MGRYAIEPDNATKSAKAKGSNLRVHFKNTRETAQVIKAMDKKAVDSNKSEKMTEEKMRLVSSLSESKKELESHSSLVRSLQSEIQKLNSSCQRCGQWWWEHHDQEGQVEVPQHNPPVEQIHPGRGKNDHHQEEVGGHDQFLC